MSVESAKLFIERMKTDEGFAVKVIACKDAETRMAFVQKNGFDFTAEEVNESVTELTDEELMTVSGGGICWIELTLGCKSYQMGNMLIA